MPMMKVCSVGGCNNTTQGRYCSSHTKLRHKDYDSKRPTSRQRGYDSKWEKLRNLVRREEPLCRECSKHGRIRSTEHIDHIIPVATREDLRLVRENLQGLCSACHVAKTKADTKAGLNNKFNIRTNRSNKVRNPAKRVKVTV